VSHAGGDNRPHRSVSSRRMYPSVALLGAGTLGEIVIGALLAAGWPTHSISTLESRPERVEELKELHGIANIGVRPTVDGETLLLEVHLFDFAQDIYGQHMRVALVDHLRPELQFDGLQALKAQIAEDSERARVILTWENWEAGWPSSPFRPTGDEPGG